MRMRLGPSSHRPRTFSTSPTTAMATATGPCLTSSSNTCPTSAHSTAVGRTAPPSWSAPQQCTHGTVITPTPSWSERTARGGEPVHLRPPRSMALISGRETLSRSKPPSRAFPRPRLPPPPPCASPSLPAWPPRHPTPQPHPRSACGMWRSAFFQFVQS